MSASACTDRDAARLLDLIGGAWATQVIAAAVELGLPSLLAQSPASAAALAHHTGCDADGLLRLLRAMVSLDLCHVDENGRFALTAMGELLIADRTGSLHDWALWWGRHLWPLWGDLAASVRTGRSARERHTGRSGYAHLTADAQAAALFNSAMRQLTARVAAALLQALDWRGVRCLVDVGGGYGELLAGVLRGCPTLHGVLVELPHALDGAQAHLMQAGVADRCTLVAADFFERVPPGGDIYAIKSVLHNWDDAACGRLLRTCRQAMTPPARLLLIERVLPETMQTGPAARAVARADLNMLVGVGGRERTQAQIEHLLRDAGYGEVCRRADVEDFALIEARVA
jgi:hypothetical protein